MGRWPARSEYERFMSHVDASAGPDGCWLWTAARHESGYGLFSSSGRNVRAARWVLGHLRGEPLRWDEELHEEACHHCDNPPCVNPAHLYVGDRSQNMKDAWDRDRFSRVEYLNANAQKTHCPRGHSYSGQNLMFQPNGRYRRCRECKNAAARAAYGRRKVT